MQSDIIDPPEVLGKGVQKTEEMTFRELWEYTRRLQEAGIKNTKLLIDMQSRISYPLINVIMIVLGVSLAMRGGMKSGLVTTAVGICIGLLYWVGYTTSLSLGYTAILPPVMAAWIIPLVFGGAAVYLFRRIPE
jgi:lipopolysaccharide export system permease protein